MMASCGTVNQVCRKLSKLRKTVSNQKKNFIGKDGDPSEINPKERYCSLTNEEAQAVDGKGSAHRMENSKEWIIRQENFACHHII